MLAATVTLWLHTFNFLWYSDTEFRSDSPFPKFNICIPQSVELTVIIFMRVKTCIKMNECNWKRKHWIFRMTLTKKLYLMCISDAVGDTQPLSEVSIGTNIDPLYLVGAFLVGQVLQSQRKKNFVPDSTFCSDVRQNTDRNLSEAPQYPLCLCTSIKNIWHYYYKLKLSAFMALQSELILVLSTYSAWGLFTACSVVVCSVPINVLQTTTKSKQNQTHPCQTTQQTHCAPSSSGLAFFAVIFHQRTFTALTTSPEPPKMLHMLLKLHHAYPLPLHPRTNIPSIAKRGISLRGDRALQSNRRVSVLVPHTNRVL